MLLVAIEIPPPKDLQDTPRILMQEPITTENRLCKGLWPIVNLPSILLIFYMYKRAQDLVADEYEAREECKRAA